VITGSFSLTLQAIQLGYCPRLRIEHTSHEQIGQIYIPAVNRSLMFASIALVLGFHSSSNLAAAYGIAITVTMVITTILFFFLVKNHWKWHPAIAAGFALAFLVIDLSFFGANVAKILHGGWFPLVMAGIVYTLMSTWRDGRRLLAARLRASMLSTELFVADLLSNPPVRVPGVAVFMSGNPMGTPLALRQNVAHNHVLHDCNIILGVRTAEVPHVAPDARLETEEIGEGFFRISQAGGVRGRQHRSDVGELLSRPRDGVGDRPSGDVGVAGEPVRLYGAERPAGDAVLSFAKRPGGGNRGAGGAVSSLPRPVRTGVARFAGAADDGTR
jgi:KUP system potassium uptake protein